MNIDLGGKTALDTGSTEGIGFAIAQGLAKAGATVIVNGRTGAKVEAAVARIGGDTRGVAADLGTAAGHKQLVAAEPQADIVVSNLGIFQPVDFFDTDDAIWDRHWQVNVMAGVRLARAYLPGMQASGWGRFLLLGSESAFNIPADIDPDRDRSGRCLPSRPSSPENPARQGRARPDRRSPAPIAIGCSSGVPPAGWR